MIKDLTVGKPLPVLIKYALPLLGSVIFQQIYNIADSFVAGQYLGTNALAAVGDSYEITLVFIAIAFGCNIGTSTVTAIYYGKKDYTNVKTTIYTSLIVSSLIGVILTIAGFFSAEAVLRLINTPEILMKDALQYIQIYIAGYLFLLLYNISTGIFAALGDSLTPFIFLAVSSIANVFMDIMFVKYANMGVPGVAWATFICQGLSGIISFIVVIVKVYKIKSEEKPKIFDFGILKELIKIGLPGTLQQLFVSVGNIILQSFINSFGTSAMGGYTAAIKINNLAILSIVTLGTASANYSAQNYGAKKYDRIKEGWKSGLLITAIVAAVLSVLYITLRSQLIGLFITDGDMDALDIGCKFLIIVAPFYVFSGLKIISDSVLRGTKHISVFMFSTLLDLVLRVGFAAIFAFACNLGVNGIWWSWPVGWITAEIVSFTMYIIISKRDFAELPNPFKKHSN